MTEQNGTLSDPSVVRRRTQMGEAIRGWGTIPGAQVEVASTHWMLLSGAPSPDVNVVLVHGGDEAVLEGALAKVAQVGAPALVCLTGDASSRTMPAPWQEVGTMPFMSADLARVPGAPDAQVRLATADDLEVTVGLLADAYDMEASIARLCVEPVLTGVTAGVSDMRFWLLTDGDQPVSTVLDARSGDAITLWCMATPERFGRRGYGRRLLGHVLHAARGDGLALGLLGATPAGHPLYESTGWHTIEDWRLFLNGASVQFG